MYICERKNINLKFKDVLNKLKESFNYVPYNLDLNIIINSLDLIKLDDIHDRIIVAIAKVLNAGLITKDKSIKQTDYVKCIW